MSTTEARKSYYQTPNYDPSKVAAYRELLRRQSEYEKEAERKRWARVTKPRLPQVT